MVGKWLGRDGALVGDLSWIYALTRELSQQKLHLVRLVCKNNEVNRTRTYRSVAGNL